MTIETVLRDHPGSAQVFRSFGLPCAECVMAPWDDIATGARTHGIDPIALLTALNTAASSAKRHHG